VTRSHYEAYIGHRYFANDGAQAGGSGKSGAVIIMTGAAYDSGQVLYGNKKVGGGRHSYDQILQSMEVCSNAYHNAWQSVRSGYITMVWGTGTTFPAAWNTNLGAATDAGKAMAITVRKFARWVADPVRFTGRQPADDQPRAGRPRNPDQVAADRPDGRAGQRPGGVQQHHEQQLGLLDLGTGRRHRDLRRRLGPAVPGRRVVAVQLGDALVVCRPVPDHATQARGWDERRVGAVPVPVAGKQIDFSRSC
jgi:hypothetical protein